MSNPQPQPLFVVTHSTLGANAFWKDTPLVKLKRPIQVCWDAAVTRKEEGTRFRLYDDDDNLYFEGTMYGSTSSFAPLNWSSLGYGCTRLDYFENGKWATL